MKYPIITLSIFFSVLTGFAREPIAVTSFGALPNDGQNDEEALRKAVEACKANPGATLYFAPGVYDFRDEKAVQLQNDAMSGKLGKNPQDVIFKPYYPYVKGLDFSGVHDVTIEAAGATLLVDGWMEPVSLNRCRNITLKGLTIDYKRKPNTVGLVTDVQPGWFDVKLEKGYAFDNSMSILRLKFWDARAHRELPEVVWEPISYPNLKMLDAQTLRVFRKIDPAMKGNYMTTVHGFHFRPAILIEEAENTRIEDVTIHAQPGMGIVGNRAHTIIMAGLRVVPTAGTLISTNTDATHFVSCTGLIRFENCQFEGQGDDVTNVHNYYYTLQKPANGKGYDLLFINADTHAGVLDYPDPGDTLELVHKSSLAAVKNVVIKTREINIAQFRSHVTLSEALPADIENYYLVNISRLPRLEMVGCTAISNFSTGVNIKTRSALVERCLFRETTGNGINVSAEGGWHEGPGAANVVIRYNRIIRCGTGAGADNDACGINISVGGTDKIVPGIHKQILIEGNIIEGDTGAQNGIYISDACDVEVRYNEISGCKTPIKVEHSEKVNVHDNPGVGDFKVE